ncbi:hypothetical protein TSUD_308520 [Trifolium subterraneum]|nr:hypothetical protein TSUD_308520 [Trifolium subterraneum]
MLKDGFTLKIGNGNSNFWYDSWVFKEKLCSFVPFVAIQDTQLQPYMVDDLPDVWTWHNSSVGLYTVKEAYEWLLPPLPINNQVNWKWIWQLQLPSNIQFFIWQMLHNSIPTREVLHHRWICVSNICPRCSTMVETIEHCLFWCVEAVCVWKACGLERVLPSLQVGNLFSWCREVCSSHGNIVFIVMWFVWCARNDFLFNNRKSSMHDTAVKIQSTLECCAIAFNKQLVDSPRTSNPRIVTWSRPTEGTVCLNVGGSLLGSTQTAGFGGLIRNSAGAFLGGFYGVASMLRNVC